jgi:hypothetical protein
LLQVNIAYQSGDVCGIIDSRMSSYPPECVKRFLSLAIRCCRDETEARPYMADIVRELETIRSMLPEGEDVLSSTSGSGLLTKSMSSSSTTTTTGALYVSSHISGSGQADSGIPSGMVAPR